MESLLESFSKLKEDLKNLEVKLLKISSKDYILNNKILEENFEQIQKENFNLREKLKKIEEEKRNLQASLMISIYTERAILLNNEIRKIKNVISKKMGNELQKIEQIKKEINFEVNRIQKEIQKENGELKEKLMINLENFKQENSQILLNIKEKIEEHTKITLDEQIVKLENLKGEEIPQNVLETYFNKRNFERLVGLNLINKLGILMILIGVIVLSKYSIDLISNVMKGIIIFFVGGSMLITGELLSKKKKSTIFSIGMISGGIGVIYTGVAVSFFMLNILSGEMAIGLYILISLLGILLSLKYTSQVILSFALVGGYLPFIYIIEDRTYSSALYLFFAGFGAFSFLVSFKKKWIFTTYLGFFLNVFTISMLPVLTLEIRTSSTKSYIIALLYIVYSFIIYTLIPIISNYKLKKNLKKLDVILISINTFLSGVFLYGLFHFAGWDDFYGLLAIILAIIYIFLAKGLERKFSIAENVITLFYLTGLTFIALVVPLQLGKIWITLGWLIQGIILLKFGLLSGRKEFEKFGLILSILTLFHFIGFDILQSDRDLFLLKYSAVTFGLTYVNWLYLKYKSNLKIPIEILKTSTIINIVLYLRYILLYSNIPYKIFEEYSYKLEVYLELFWIAMIYFIGLFITTNSKIKNKSMHKLSIGIYGIGLLNISYLIGGYGMATYQDSRILICLKLIIGMWIAIVFLSKFLKEIEFNLNYYPVILAVYLVFMSIRGITLYLDIKFFSLLITGFIFICSILMISIGFIKGYYYLRRIGLFLILFGVLKLFVFDFIILTPINKVISYFALGISLIVVSYIYQYFDKKFTLNIQEEKN